MSDKNSMLQELAPDPRSRSPSLACRRYFIKSPSKFPTASLGIDPNTLLSHLEKDEAYTLITDVTLSPKLIRTTTPTPTPRAISWSPSCILQNHRCVLSVLCDMGGLTLHSLTASVADVSSLWLKHCHTLWAQPDPSATPSQLLQQLRTRADMVRITAMCWLSDGEYFITVSKSGLAAVWKISPSDDKDREIKVSLVAKFDCGLQSVCVLHAILLPSDSYMLLAGIQNGRIESFTFPFIKESFDSKDLITISPIQIHIWEEEDKIAPSHLIIWPWEDGYLLSAVKGPFLLQFYLDEQGTKRTFCAYRCSDISINGLSRISASEMLIVTRSVRMSKVTVTHDNGALVVTTTPVESYINISHMGCYGINLTHNKVVCFIMLSVNQAYDHLRLREPSQVVICSVSGINDPLKALLEPERPVSELWDCLELTRVQILQKSVESDVTFPRAVLDTMSLDQLTITLWWTTFATLAEEDEAKQQTLLSLRSEVESLVVSCHFFKRIASLLSSPVESLTSFQRESLGLITKWLRLQSLPSEFTTTLITAKTLQQQLEPLQHLLPADELCTICRSKVELSVSTKLFIAECERKHRLPRCSLSLVQCGQLPYYICSQCGALAHRQAVLECGDSCYLCGGVLRMDENILHLT